VEARFDLQSSLDR